MKVISDQCLFTKSAHFFSLIWITTKVRLPTSVVATLFSPIYNIKTDFRPANLIMSTAFAYWTLTAFPNKGRIWFSKYLRWFLSINFDINWQLTIDICQLTIQDYNILKLYHISLKNSADDLRLATIKFKTSTDTDLNSPMPACYDQLAIWNSQISLTKITSTIQTRENQLAIWDFPLSSCKDQLWSTLYSPIPEIKCQFETRQHLLAKISTTISAVKINLKLATINSQRLTHTSFKLANTNLLRSTDNLKLASVNL